jgi:exodeoxyribonuclease V alpha subunit
MKAAMKIRDKFGDKAVTVLKQEPFRLCLIRGFGFLTADKIARKLHTPMDSEYRIKEATRYCLNQNGGAGHLFMEKNDLMEAAYKLLNSGFDKEAVGEARIKEIANQMVRQEQIRHVGGFIYLQRDFIHEKQFVEDIARLFQSFRPYVDADRAVRLIQKAQEKFGLQLAEKQFHAVFGGLTNPVHIITGGPGTGKTTVLCVLVDALQSAGITPEEIVLVAPTGRAAQRMRQSTGFYASTIHSYLRLYDEESDETDEDAEAAKEIKYVIMDESSMTDMELSYRLLKAMPDGAAIIFVGDVHQLPSIGPGNVLREMIASEVIPVTELVIGYRQGKESTIPINADKIKEGQYTLLYKSDFAFIPAKTEDQTMELLVNRYAEYYEAGKADGVQILCPKREKGACCSDNLNRIIQERFNPWDGQSLQIQSGSRMFRVNDKVMQNKNKSGAGISNGDIGVIKEIRRCADNEKELEAVIEFDTAAGTRVYRRRDFEHVDHSFATTIHKAQGGEFPVVMIPLIYNKMLMKRNLIYTGVTRGKERVEIFGEKRALIVAIKTEDTSKRNTLVARRLVNAFGQINPS